MPCVANEYSHMHTNTKTDGNGIIYCTYNHTHILMINTKFRIMIASWKTEEKMHERLSFRFLTPISTWKLEKSWTHHQQAIPGHQLGV